MLARCTARYCLIGSHDGKSESCRECAPPIRPCQHHLRQHYLHQPYARQSCLHQPCSCQHYLRQPCPCQPCPRQPCLCPHCLRQYHLHQHHLQPYQLHLYHNKLYQQKFFCLVLAYIHQLARLDAANASSLALSVLIIAISTSPTIRLKHV
ncbi:hypothetical protein L211DRAFT_140398 [Terfezia boudieri ATCC MYA-4762]|uniref:Uncharacterized protein n=1 Tax=Terfezia boudieri ATCC MYA-4762 TaxID=1051890 RepID=A0A3N4L9T0_9PEZI|nr:hypothetical protein L211DRAFT_140398 [Terfezia boudieri ATCC MYA-4762]